MKKNIFIAVLMCFAACANAQENGTFKKFRAELFQESKQIKALMATTKDPVMVSSMLDSCIMSINQVDAYFIMLGIVNTVKKEALTEEITNFLLNWLDMTKKNNILNLKALTGAPKNLEPRTQVYVEKLIEYYKNMDQLIEEEINKVNVIKQSVQANQPDKK